MMPRCMIRRRKICGRGADGCPLLWSWCYGKKRDIKYHATPESLQSITELQRQIVAAGWQYVKPHGVLLYSTCTIHRGENQEMAVWITENFPFVLEEERQLLPGTDETDGFYYARLRRKA